MTFTGYHRLRGERDLWQDGRSRTPHDRRPPARRCHHASSAQVKGRRAEPAQLAERAEGAPWTMATGKITGEEERYSHTDLWDSEANFEGSKTALAALRPFLTGGPGARRRDRPHGAEVLGDLLETDREG